MLETIKKNINQEQSDINFRKTAGELLNEASVEDAFFKSVNKEGVANAEELEKMIEEVPEYQENEELTEKDFALAIKSSDIVKPLKDLI